MLDYFIYPAEFSNNTVHFMFRELANLSYIKVFLWSGLENTRRGDGYLVLFARPNQTTEPSPCLKTICRKKIWKSGSDNLEHPLENRIKK